MKRLFHNVVWPAVAGNVAWAFFTVLVEAHWSDHIFWARLAALLAVGIYLAADWYNTDEVFSKINPSYWVADAFLAPAIAVFAIATQARNPWAVYAIAVTFFVAIIGHLFGAWDDTAPGTSAIKERRKLAAVNAMGLLIIGVAALFGPPYTIWSAPIAIALVVTIFLAYAYRHR